MEFQLAPVSKGQRGGVDPTLTETDEKQLADAGFRCIRLVFSPNELNSTTNPDTVDAGRVSVLLRTIEDARQVGLSVIVAPRLHRKDFGTAASTLGRLAGLLGNTDVNTTFLELCSEPLNMDADAWQIVEGSWVSSIRQNMPRHTLIVRAGGKDGPNDLLAFPPLDDRNLVYAFQYFEPTSFTGQWLADSPLQEADKVTLPYPATVGDIVPLISNLSDSQKDWAMQYGRERWDSTKLSETMRPIGDWSRSQKVRVLCDGFGVSQKVTASNRAKYFQDLKGALNDAGIGWTLSEYVGARGVYSGAPGVRSADSGVLAALGLSG